MLLLDEPTATLSPTTSACACGAGWTSSAGRDGFHVLDAVGGRGAVRRGDRLVVLASEERLLFAGTAQEMVAAHGGGGGGAEAAELAFGLRLVSGGGRTTPGEGGLLLLRKDAVLLRRSPALLLVLVVCRSWSRCCGARAAERRAPAGRGGGEPGHASGRTVDVGGNRLSIDDYIDRLAEDVDVRRLDAEAAADALDAGRVSAVVTIPEEFISDLQSGVRQPALRLAASRRSPIEADAITRRLEGAVYRLQPAARHRLRRAGARAGGPGDERRRDRHLRPNGRRPGPQAQPRARGRAPGAAPRGRRRGDAAGLAPLLNFIDETQRNLDLARGSTNAIRAPIVLEVTEGAEGREPLSAFGSRPPCW